MTDKEKSINDIEDTENQKDLTQEEEDELTDPDDPRNAYSKTIEEPEDSNI